MAHHAESSKSNQNPLRDARIGGIWRLGRKIGSGSFGDIYKGRRLVLRCTPNFVVVTCIWHYSASLWKRRKCRSSDEQTASLQRGKSALTVLYIGQPGDMCGLQDLWILAAFALGVNVQTGEEVAMKVESAKAKHPQLIYESKLIKHLQGAPGIAQIYYCDAEADFNIMVMELLGPSLEDLFNLCSRQFTLRTILMIADQVVSTDMPVQEASAALLNVEPICSLSLSLDFWIFL